MRHRLVVVCVLLEAALHPAHARPEPQQQRRNLTPLPVKFQHRNHNPAKGHQTLRVATIQLGPSGYPKTELERYERQGQRPPSRFEQMATMIIEAKNKGADVIVTPETGGPPELDPRPGDNPARDRRWDQNGLMSFYSQLAQRLGVTLVYHTTTHADPATFRPPAPRAARPAPRRGRRAAQPLTPEQQQQQQAWAKLMEERRNQPPEFSTAVAVDPRGTVVAKHNKFHLFMGERGWYKPGDTLKHSVFQTPAGPMGLLVCADMQSINNKKQRRLLTELMGKKELVGVCYPLAWVRMSNNPKWDPNNLQQKFATLSNMWVFASNATQGQSGSGIYEPGGGKVVATDGAEQLSSILYADVPYAHAQH